MGCLMRVTVFGATGKTGKLVVARLLAAGHDVVALARTPSKLDFPSAAGAQKLTIVQGDVLDAAAVERAVTGADAVISVLGPPSNAAEFVVTRGMQNILAAMQKQNIRRLVMSTGAGVGDTGDEPKWMDKLIVALLKLVSKNVLEDMVRAVALVRASDRDWTIVRVPMLTDEPPRASVRAGAVGKDIGTRLGRADLAAFLASQLESKTFLRRAPAISS